MAAACRALGGTAFCARAGITATTSVMKVIHKIVRKVEVGAEDWVSLCMAFASLPSDGNCKPETGAIRRQEKKESDLFSAAWERRM